MKHVVDNLSVFEQFANMVYGLAVITEYERFLFAIFTEQLKQGAQLILCRCDYFFDGKLRRSIGIGRKIDGHKIANPGKIWRSEEHTSELQSRENLVCRLLLEK